MGGPGLKLEQHCQMCVLGYEPPTIGQQNKNMVNLNKSLKPPLMKPIGFQRKYENSAILNICKMIFPLDFSCIPLSPALFHLGLLSEIVENQLMRIVFGAWESTGNQDFGRLQYYNLRPDMKCILGEDKSKDKSQITSPKTHCKSGSIWSAAVTNLEYNVNILKSMKSKARDLQSEHTIRLTVDQQLPKYIHCPFGGGEDPKIKGRSSTLEMWPFSKQSDIPLYKMAERR